MSHDELQSVIEDSRYVPWRTALATGQDGHGGNAALRELAEVDLTHRRHFMFNILRVFGPNATSAEVD